MVFKTLTGSSKRVKKPKNYLIKWDGQSLSKLQFLTKLYCKTISHRYCF